MKISGLYEAPDDVVDREMKAFVYSNTSWTATNATAVIFLFWSMMERSGRQQWCVYMDLIPSIDQMMDTRPESVQVKFVQKMMSQSGSE